MSMTQHIARNLALAFLAGPWTFDGMRERGAEACGRRQRALADLIESVLGAFGEDPTHVHPDTLTCFIQGMTSFQRGSIRGWTVRRLFWLTPAMTPHPGAAASWQVPPLTTAGALADWLNLSTGELDWFADRQGREAKVPAGPLRHYTYRWLPRRGGRWRLLEMPKARLKALQRRILHEILDRIPPHDAVHGYRRGRSLAGYVAPHVGRDIVLHVDLCNFFPSIPAARVHALFRAAGYPEEVARLLTGLCTNVVPWEVLRQRPGENGDNEAMAERRLFDSPHLPQGAPTSPALANLCAYRLDRRLAALARVAGAAYTRYADDLAFSGGPELERSARRFHVHVCRIALEAGFAVHTRKTRLMRPSVRQQLAGVVVNVRPNLARSEYDRLKATLHNCIRHGPYSQNRDGHRDFRAHLAGRIAYWQWLNPARGARLRALFDRVAWDDEGGTQSGGRG
ncbi:MAG TPA: reverse transcriptase family protein [Gemmataceae bacterium]|nr:reverse transcriptase family protein [Gemmataceae bacterium]